jgi:hypothetical protein
MFDTGATMKTSSKVALGIVLGLVVIIGGGVYINDKIEEDQLRRATIQLELKRSEDMQNDKLLELSEQQTAVTKGRQACYKQFIADDKKKSIYADTSAEQMRAICNQ